MERERDAWVSLASKCEQQIRVVYYHRQAKWHSRRHALKSVASFTRNKRESNQESAELTAEQSSQYLVFTLLLSVLTHSTCDIKNKTKNDVGTVLSGRDRHTKG